MNFAAVKLLQAREEVAGWVFYSWKLIDLVDFEIVLAEYWLKQID